MGNERRTFEKETNVYIFEISLKLYSSTVSPQNAIIFVATDHKIIMLLFSVCWVILGQSHFQLNLLRKWVAVRKCIRKKFCLCCFEFMEKRSGTNSRNGEMIEIWPIRRTNKLHNNPDANQFPSIS